MHVLLALSGPDRYFDAVQATLASRGVASSRLTAFGDGDESLDIQRTADFPRAAATIRRHLQGVDLVHAHEPISGLLAAVATRWRVPMIYHRHHSRTAIRPSFYGAVATVAARRVITVSKTATFGFPWERIPRRKLNTIYNGIAPLRPVTEAEVRALRAVHSLPDSNIVVCVGRMRAEKNQARLLEASSVAQKHTPFHLVLVGDGPNLTTVRAVAERLDVAVTITGHQEDVAPWYALADVVVVPSTREAFGLTATEAFAARRPLIAANVGGLAEVADPSTAVFVQPTDVTALGDAILRLLNDDDERRMLAEAGHAAYLERFTVDRMVDRWIEEYELVLSSGTDAQAR